MKYWLVKTEPESYSWQNLVDDKVGVWDGVRNYQARNNLKEMKVGDVVFIYHSNTGLEIVGLAKVVTEHYPDPKADDIKWVAVDLEPQQKLKKTVTLKQIKEEPRLADIALLKLSRLSVVPIKEEEYKIIVELSNEV
jgi:predicted RNA-binding protein with PUA-like domain